jgi:hypothetical protein
MTTGGIVLDNDGHLPLSFLEAIDHLATCHRCQQRAMTRAVFNDLLALVYGDEPAPE